MELPMGIQLQYTNNRPLSVNWTGKCNIKDNEV